MYALGILDEMQLIQWTLHMKFSEEMKTRCHPRDMLFDWQCH